MVLFCILLISSEAEHLFMYLSAILIFSFVKCSFKFHVQIYIELDVIFIFHISRSSEYILALEIWFLSIINITSYSVVSLFTLFKASFDG